MALNRTYLITGANRGIGLVLTRTLLLRPNTTVIATIRSNSTPTTDLSSLPTAENSSLLIVPFALDTTAPSAAGTTLLETLSKQNITKIDVLILNAGTATSFLPVLSTSLASLTEHFEANTLLPILIFQTLFPLLSPDAKVILISSSLGSIGDMENAVPTLAYGVSKAGANFFVRKVHFEHQGLTAVAVHPGWVKTGNGQVFADSIGVSEPPLTAEESVKGVLAQIDGATREKISGAFVSYDGTAIKW